jgi:tetratricopeptide (TPR) repeat protein
MLLHRSWCLFELWTALRQGCRVTLWLLRREVVTLNAAILDDFVALLLSFCSVSFQASTSSLPHDHTALRGALEAAVPSLAEVDAPLQHFLEEWCLLQAEHLLLEMQAIGDAESETCAQLCCQLGAGMWHFGLAAPAIHWLSRSLQLYQQHRPDGPEVARLHNNLGLAYKANGDVPKAIEHFSHALTIKQQLLTGAAPVPRRTPPDSGSAAAAAAAEDAAAPAEQTGSDDGSVAELQAIPTADSSMAATHNNLGLAHLTQGALADAAQHFRRAIAFYETVPGGKDKDTGVAYNNLGLALQEQEDMDGAIACFDRALAILEASVGPEHRLCATTCNNLGNAWSSRGDLERCVFFYSRALEIYSRAAGERHLSTAVAAHNLGLACCSLGRFQQAIAYCQSAVGIFEAVLGRHSSTAVAYDSLATTYSASGDHRSAAIHFAHALDIYAAELGPTHPQTEECRAHFAEEEALLAPTVETAAQKATLAPGIRPASATSGLLRAPLQYSDATPRTARGPRPALFRRPVQRDEVSIAEAEVTECPGGHAIPATPSENASRICALL